MHPEIEKLIDLALADGHVTEKEKNIILKKATELGIDADEVEMVLDAKLHQKQVNNKVSDKIEEIKKCPSCGNVISGLSKTCVCGYVINSGNLNEVKSLETAIESLENLIVDIRTLKNNPNKILEERITAKIEKEIRYIKVRYGDDLAVKKLINELEELSNNSLYAINKKRRNRKNRLLIIFTLIILSIGLFLFRIITFKTPEQRFISDVREKYEDEIINYKTSEEYIKDSLLFYKLYNDFSSSQTEDPYNKINLKRPSPFKFYIISRQLQIKGDFEKADKYIDSCIALYPKFAPIYFRKGTSNMIGDSLLVNVNKAYSLDPNNKIKYFFLRGQILMNMQEYEKALNDFYFVNANTKDMEYSYTSDLSILNCLFNLGRHQEVKSLHISMKKKYPKKEKELEELELKN